MDKFVDIELLVLLENMLTSVDKDNDIFAKQLIQNIVKDKDNLKDLIQVLENPHPDIPEVFELFFTFYPITEFNKLNNEQVMRLFTNQHFEYNTSFRNMKQQRLLRKDKK